MPRFTPENAVAALALQQLVNDWGHDLDAHGGVGVAEMCAADCTYLVGGKPHVGHAEIAGFYAARNERVRLRQRDGVRTQRHTISNMRFSFEGGRHAGATFLLVNYSEEGAAPATNLIGPTIIADCRMEFRPDHDGDWRIALFDSKPVFIGDDPFLNASVLEKG